MSCDVYRPLRQSINWRCWLNKPERFSGTTGQQPAEICTAALDSAA
ncbi:MAG: hypothetical protein P0107_04960 [Nitrosomonas sp.]|nr:hypothetical protein [Nitrosomonas sp.]